MLLTEENALEMAEQLLSLQLLSSSPGKSVIAEQTSPRINGDAGSGGGSCQISTVNLMYVSETIVDQLLMCITGNQFLRFK